MRYRVIDPISSVINLVTSVVSRVWPDKTEQQKEAFTLELTRELNDTQLLTKQIDVNVAQASNPNLFVSGARPAAMWVCVLGFSWQFVVLPILLFIGNASGHVIPAPPFDTATLVSMLSGMLGLGIMRSYDKKQGTSQ